MDNRQTLSRTEFRTIPDGEIEALDLVGCTFLRTDARDAKILDCTFEGSTLSSVKVAGAVIQARFKDSKIEGINFFEAKQKLLSLAFDSCLIRYCSFATLTMRGIHFTNCTLEHVDFADADLTEADFSGSKFNECTFQNTNLTKANFTYAEGYVISPLSNKLTKARFSSPEVLSLLGVFGIEIE